MPTIDLTRTDLRPPRPSLHGVRRLGLTLPELQLAARLAGDVPLPFDVAEPLVDDGLQARLGVSPVTADDRAFRSALTSLHDPAGSLARRGLVVDGQLEPGVAGALGLLATPRIALDVDVRVGEAQARAWHRSRDGAVATLATADGIVLELAWLATARWPGELARVPALPDDLPREESAVGSVVDLPFELADSAAEALRSGRADLLPTLAARHRGGVVVDGRVVDDASAVRLLAALSAEARGRLRALVADVAPARDHRVEAAGVVAWTLLADGWHALRPHQADGEARLLVSAVGPGDLAATIAPTLAPLTTSVVS